MELQKNRNTSSWRFHQVETETINIVSEQGWVTQCCYYNPLTPQDRWPPLSQSLSFLCMKGSDNSQLPVSHKTNRMGCRKVSNHVSNIYICSQLKYVFYEYNLTPTMNVLSTDQELPWNFVNSVTSFYQILELCRLCGLLLPVPLCAGGLQGVVAAVHADAPQVGGGLTHRHVRHVRDLGHHVSGGCNDRSWHVMLT